MACRLLKENTDSIRKGGGDLISPGLLKKLQSRLKEEFGTMVDTLEVQDSSPTWTSITWLGRSAGGYSVSLQINLTKETSTRT